MIDLLRNTSLGNRINLDADEYEELHASGGGREEEFQPNVARIGLLLVLYMIPLSLIAYGGVHIHDCPAQNMIPVSLIVIGSIVFLSRIVSSRTEYLWAFRNGNGQEKSGCLICINLVLQIVLMGWFIAMCVFVYGTKPDTKSGDHDLPNYCDEYFYRGAFWASTIGLILFGLMFVLLIVACCCMCYVGRNI